MKKLLIPIILLGLILGAVFLFEKNPRIEQEAVVHPEDSKLALADSAFQSEPENTYTPGALNIPIYIYHSVRPHIQGEGALEDAYDVTPQLLEEELIYLRDNGYTTISLDDLVKDIKNGTTSPVAKPVILTFDDGWRNEYKNAFPLLKKYHDTATFYVYTNPIGLDHYMTWDQIREMDAAGMTIGSHSISHPYFKGLDTADLRREIINSKAFIEAQLHKPVVHFATPFGYSNPEIESIIREAGYVTGRTTYKGVYHDATDLIHLHGILVTDNIADFVRELNR